jgi:hypothetical protein
MAVDNQAMIDAHAEATWIEKEPGFWKNLIKMSVGNTWARTTFDGMMERGRIAEDMLASNTTWPKLNI